MGKIHVWLEATSVTEELATRRAAVEFPDGTRKPIWFRTGVENLPALDEAGDPFALALLFLAMRRREDVHVHGSVSPRLVWNLAEFQAAWSSWRPDKYVQVEVSADRLEERSDELRNAALSTFSGGVDSCFTAHRHGTSIVPGEPFRLEAGLMVHGFDIRLHQPEYFSRASQRSRLMLSSLGLELLTVATNCRESCDRWEDEHGAALAACLTLFARRFGAGLIPSTEPYGALVLPWGSNPVTDPLLSSASFQVYHDGASYTRNAKVRAIGPWQEASRNLRVCWKGSEKDRNCGVCEKCIRTVLNYRVNGLKVPECFEKDVSDPMIRGLRGLNDVQLAYLRDILACARTAGLRATWVHALGETVRQETRRGRFRRALRALRTCA